MATRIRLKRLGKKKQPFYRLVVADQRTPRDGRTVEEIGYYDPGPDPPVIHVDADRALAWLQKGAQPSETARSLLSAKGVLQQFDAMKKAKAAARKAPPEALDTDAEQDAEAPGPQATA